MKRNLFLLSVIYIFFSCSAKKSEKPGPVSVYKPVSAELYATIAEQDSLMFAAFNEQNTDKLMSFFTTDLEFYHDIGGVSGYDQNIKNFTDLFSRNKTTGLRRDLVPGSLEVYPIKDFGAVETCLHKFCHKENGKDDCGTFKNIMLWKKTDSGWKVNRVISYDH